MRVGLGIVALSVMTTLTACSSSANGSDHSGASSNEPGAPALSGKTIAIGAINGDTGSSSVKGVADGLAAFVKYLNSNGGIGGRPVSINRCDADTDPQKATECARRIAGDKSVLVAAGGETGYGSVVVPALGAASDPLSYICPVPVTPQETTATNAFCLIGTGVSYYTAMAHFKKNGATKGAFVTTDTDNGHAASQFTTQQAKSQGLEIKSTYSPPSSPDFLPEMQSVLADKPDFIMIGLAPDQLLQATKALVTLQSTVPVGTLGELLPESSRKELADAQFDIVYGSEVPDVATNKDPEIALYLDWMNKSRYSSEIGSLSLAGWLSGRVVQKVIEAIGPDKATRATIGQYLRTQTVTVPLLPPLSLAQAPKGQPAVANPTALVAMVSHGKTTVSTERVSIP